MMVVLGSDGISQLARGHINMPGVYLDMAIDTVLDNGGCLLERVVGGISAAP